MLLLDTDHLVEYQKGTSPEALRLKKRLEGSGEPFGTSIITVEELMRGWLAVIHRSTDTFHQISPYAKLRRLFQFFAKWDVLDWTPAAAAEFNALKSSKTRIGTMDLKIASIALANNATLLSRNLNDFQKVSGLRVADWLS
jgi:tRNA(fMet)-specific endonuclease VapC